MCPTVQNNIISLGPFFLKGNQHIWDQEDKKKANIEGLGISGKLMLLQMC